MARMAGSRGGMRGGRTGRSGMVGIALHGRGSQLLKKSSVANGQRPHATEPENWAPTFGFTL